MILSELTRKLTEEKLLVPEEHINTLSIVGEGKLYFFLFADTIIHYYTTLGEFGIVYCAILQDRNFLNDVVAVKTLKGILPDFCVFC